MSDDTISGGSTLVAAGPEIVKKQLSLTYEKAHV